MDHYKLTDSDLPEIGGNTTISKVLIGQRDHSRKAIEYLLSRFGLRPALFFEKMNYVWCANTGVRASLTKIKNQK